MKSLRTLRFVHVLRAIVIQKHSPRPLSTDTLVLDLEGSIRVTGADVSWIELSSRKARGIESMKSQAKKGAA